MPFGSRVFHSPALGKETRYQFALPDGEGPFPVIYFIHGFGDDDTTPFERTALAEWAEEAKNIVVCPDVEESWCCNDHRRGMGLWEDFLIQDLIDHVEKNFPVKSKRRCRSVAGFSMGGYGAMMLGLKHYELFGEVTAFAGSFQFGHALREDRPNLNPFMEAVAPPGGDYDLFRLAAEADPLTLPKIRMIVGYDDHLFDTNRRYHACLKGSGIEHTYQEVEGRHRWGWVDSVLTPTLKPLSCI